MTLGPLPPDGLVVVGFLVPGVPANPGELFPPKGLGIFTSGFGIFTLGGFRGGSFVPLTFGGLILIFGGLILGGLKFVLGGLILGGLKFVLGGLILGGLKFVLGGLILGGVKPEVFGAEILGGLKLFGRLS